MVLFHSYDTLGKVRFKGQNTPLVVSRCWGVGIIYKKKDSQKTFEHHGSFVYGTGVMRA